MKPYAALISQTSLIHHGCDNLQSTAHSPLTKTKTTLFCSQTIHGKQFKQHTLQCQKSLFHKPLQTAIYCQAYPTNVISDNINNTANWTELLKKAPHSPTDTTTDFGNKAKEIADLLMSHVQLLYQSRPDLQEVVLPICGTLLGTLFAWFAIPVFFVEFHKYISWNPVLTFLGVTTKIDVPYENSMWNALEDPVKYLIVFMAFAHIGPIVAPGISAYFPQLWKGAVVFSVVWFLRRWKNNSFSIVVANETILGLDKDKLAFLEKLSSLGLNLIAVMGLSEAFDIGAQSILTFSGVGGVATAYGSKDMMSNVLSGLTLQFQKPFSVGDSIKAGSIEGEITEIGLTTTSLIDPEELPVVVPNRVFSSEMIVNKSRVQWHASNMKIPVKIEDIDKIPLISEEIKENLRSNPNVFLGRDAPVCYLSRFEGSLGELTIGCKLIAMRKDEIFAAEQDILVQSVKIIRRNGAEV